MLLTERETHLLHELLHHGGITTATLVARFLGITAQEARPIINGLVDRGWLVYAPITLLRGATKYFQISRRSAKFFNVPNAAASRYTKREESCLQGLSRFWFRAEHSDLQFYSGVNAITLAFADHCPGTVYQPRYVAETIARDNDGICIFAFPSFDHALLNFVRSTLVKYSPYLQSVRIGFVIEEARKDQLEKILAALRQITSSPSTYEEVRRLEREIEAAESTLERIQLESKLKRLKNQANDSQPSNFALPLVTHSLF